MPYDFYLDKCLLPVAPARLQLKINNNNRTLSLINEGQVNLLKTAGLTDIEFECAVPQVRYPFAVYKDGFKNAKFFLDYFEKLKLDKAPFQFIVCRTMPDGKPLFSTNIKVSMEDYTVTESADNGFDLTVKIRLRQYRDYGTKTVTVKTDSASPNTAPAALAAERPASTVQTEKPVGIGSDVLINGRLYGTSYGDAPGQMRTNYRGKINFINLNGSHPYHVTTPDGGWLGWVTRDSVQLTVHSKQ